LLSYLQDACKENKHNNILEARIVKNVVEQKNKLELRFGLVYTNERVSVNGGREKNYLVHFYLL
jgi:hypothetical protein